MLRPGYTRVILAGISLTYMSYHPKLCTLLYGISSLLDAVDGQVARAMGQSSRFGAVLDMVTDRQVAPKPRSRAFNLRSRLTDVQQRVCSPIWLLRTQAGSFVRRCN